MSRLRVIVADDSFTCRALLRDVLEDDGDIQVVAEAASGEQLLAALARTRADLITVDLQMPGLDGMAVIELVMARHPLPILVITGQPTGSSGQLAFEAIRRGALDLLAKSAVGEAASEAALRATVRRLAAVPIVRRHAASRLPQAPISTGARAPTGPTPLIAPAPAIATPIAPRLAGTPTIIGIASSSGGPQAVAAVLRELPADFASCIAIVQHLPAGFAASFASYLAQSCRLPVSVVRETARIRPGQVLIAPDTRHLVATHTGTLVAVDGPREEGHCPAASVMFRSFAEVFGAAAVGVVLTGIGRDGTSGLLKMRQAGAYTVAQDQATSAVWGMPRAAIESEAAREALSLSGIAQVLTRLAAPRSAA